MKWNEIYLQHRFPPSIILEQCNLTPEELQMQIPPLHLFPENSNPPLQIVQCGTLQNENAFLVALHSDTVGVDE